MSALRSLTSRPRRRSDVWLRSSGDETVLVDPTHEAAHVLNSTAQALWELCDGETTVEEMVDAIVRLFDADDDRVRHDVLEAVEEMAAKDLLVIG